MERLEAKALGLKRYTTGRPCQKGHSGERSTSTTRCTQCVRDEMHERRHVQGLRALDTQRELERLKDPIKREAKALRWAARLEADPDYKATVLERHREQARRRYQDPTVKEGKRQYKRSIQATERYRQLAKERYDTDPNGQRTRFRKSRYGVSHEDFTRQIEAQDGMCGNPACDADVGYSSALDHCHTSGKVRGILCTRCNFIEGVIDKQMDRLLGLIEYREAGGVWVNEPLKRTA